MYLRQLDSGSWRVIVKHGGQQRSATAPTRNEAQRIGSALLITLGGGPHRIKAPVGEVLSNYVARRRRRWSPGYLADVCAVIDNIPTSFLDKPAGSIRPSTVDDLYDQLAARGWTAHRLRRLHEILSAAWAEARRVDMVVGAPTADVPKPQARRNDLTIPSDNDVAAMLAASSDTDRLAIRVAATLGIRRGEVVGLQWRDVALAAGNVTIRRALSYSPASGVVEGDTKTGYSGHRVLALDDTTLEAMRAHRATMMRLAEQEQVEARWVFSDDAGVTPWRPDRLTHVFARARKQAGVTGVRLHDLRHYVAVSMLQDGVPLHDVAGQLGHTSEQTTATVYAHYLPGRGRESVQRRGARLG